MSQLLQDLDFTSWTWAIAMVAFFGLEMLIPGIAFLWLAIASGIVSIAVFLFPDMSWEWQVVIFSILAVICTFAGRRYIRKSGEIPSDNELLNRRSDALVGKLVKVTVAIEDGRGKVKVGDSLWTALGDDMPAGTTVEVVAATGTELRVRRHQA